MSKIGMPKMSLLTEFLCDDIEKLWSQINAPIFFCDYIIFYKNLKIFSQWKF